MAGPPASSERVRTDGKFFRVGRERFHVKGVCYGTFGPNRTGDRFPEPEQVQRDFELIRELGANVARVYDLPPPWLLDLAGSAGLKLLVDVPWHSQSCFLDSGIRRREARAAITSAARLLAGHPAVMALSLANEIPPDIVRWSGARRVAEFIDELVFAAHEVDPECLCTLGNFPPTEYLEPRHLDFVTFNVFLHDRSALQNYLWRLQMIADGKPLVLGECGVDARREGPTRQAEILAGMLTAAFRTGLAGAIVFAFTDDWVRAGQRVEDWQMGITTAARERRPAFQAAQEAFACARRPEIRRIPRVSVVVACYNGARTLELCLGSLETLDYPDYEVIVVDDGSTDATAQIVGQFGRVRLVRHSANLGLSVARNTGIAAASGEIIAFTDADCRADADWLQHVVRDLLSGPYAGVGGHNLLPPDDSAVAATVMAAPGGPAHVMLTDRLAEHLPGCNMAFWKWALEAIDGFDPDFRKAGDDVDVCWRLQRRGDLLGFSPAGFVWHYRRSTVRDYLRQQAGYGEAEAILIDKHPENFNAIGGTLWQGRIYSSERTQLPWRRSVVYHGVFATGMFQTLYSPAVDGVLPFLTSLEYHVLIALPLAIVSLTIPWLRPLAVIAIAVPPGLCLVAASRASIPRAKRRWWSRPLVALLFYLQPVVRGATRYRARFNLRPSPGEAVPTMEGVARQYESQPVRERAYWSATWRERSEWIRRMLEALRSRRWACRADAGWSSYDIEVVGSQWSRVELVTAVEGNRDRSQTLRCRMVARWSLSAIVLFWGLSALQFIALGVIGISWRAWWVPAVTQSLLAWYLHARARTLRCEVSVVLDEVADGWGLKRLPVGPGVERRGDGEFPVDTPAAGTV